MEKLYSIIFVLMMTMWGFNCQDDANGQLHSRTGDKKSVQAVSDYLKKNGQYRVYAQIIYKYQDINTIHGEKSWTALHLGFI